MSEPMSLPPITGDEARKFYDSLTPNQRKEFLKLPRAIQIDGQINPSFIDRIHLALLDIKDGTRRVVRKIGYSVGNFFHDLWKWFITGYRKKMREHPWAAQVVYFMEGIAIGFTAFILAYSVILFGFLLVLLLLGV